MECMVCLTVPAIFYRLNNCCHEVCNRCARTLRAQYENPWKNMGIYPAPPNTIRCPMCRSLETILSIDDLSRLYPEAYMYWFHFKCFATPYFTYKKEKTYVKVYNHRTKKSPISKQTKKCIKGTVSVRPRHIY